jgi:hypothetical protein
MELADFYPEPQALIDSEDKVLGFLRNNGYIVERQSEIAEVAKRTYERYRQHRSGFAFASHLSVRHAEMFRQAPPGSTRRNVRPNVHLVIAAQIQLANSNVYSNVSYCLAVCRIRSTHPSILRKFHFDITVNRGQGSSRRQPHPRSHLQYCGEMLPCMSQLGRRNEQLDQMHVRLSEPRIFFWPMSLALLIDMALREFPDQHSTKFLEDSYWRGLVRRQEALVLRPFYERCLEVIRDTKGDNQTRADAFYVK